VNKKLQNFIFSIIQDPNESASKRSLGVMIDLYRKRIWNDDKTVNVIAEGCLHQNPKICLAACKFFLQPVLFEDDAEDDSSSDEEDARALMAH